MNTLPGPTLADTTGQQRIRKLEVSRDNLLAQVAEKMESIEIMNYEIGLLKADEMENDQKQQFVQGLKERHGKGI